MNKKQATYSNRKISEAFLDFAFPLMTTMPDDASEPSIERVPSIAFVVWNGMLLDDANGNEHYMSRVGRQASGDPVLQALLRELVHRGRTFFADGQPLIGNYKVTRQPAR